MLTEIEIEERLPVWDALSELFLDNELDEMSHKYIANSILESNFTPQEIHSILWDEVFPSVADNLRSVAGEWAGFDRQWLSMRILSVITGEIPSLGKYGLISVESLIEITKKEWIKVCNYMPVEFRNALLVEIENMPVRSRLFSKKWWN